MPTLNLHAPHQSRLYGITDDVLMPNEQLFSKVEAALKAGLAFLQYRQKSGTFVEREQQARRLLTLCRRYNTPLIINDDLELALSIDADGVHLGQTDSSIKEARQRLGVDKIIGATCHDSLELAEQAVQEGTSYIAFGRFFPSNTKPNARPADLAILQQAKQRFQCPVVAIGGINQDNAQQLIENGADYIAVVHSLFASDQPDQAVKGFQQALSPALHEGY
ncbi:thiamine-phosphate pyrophosphorylase [Oceanospirillum multiglobuliferum]|uniref:Thiamine-phosphate synthase n=1 Tax=Oceanospirillum multiglobuliferum TaxID=64969 RepID=A0A1T4RF26_9GAMM|nr:thiamine phosphate synthase [Oceanospirillum multiglobuliferum]OPX54913.1 thiamine-phosphate diphosphorylase [Oceanospirillum multiglobuliferum]SKA14416.1 thiamine-phosphate pyrophosphorylase [Oceanospirillum multiglobuliferum]